MANFLRLLVALIGSLSLLAMAQHWFAPDAVLAERGLGVIGAMGRASARADIGGIFAGIGIFALLAAWRQSRTWLLAAIILSGSALAGRLLSFVVDGNAPGVVAPILIEAGVISVFLIAYRAWTSLSVR
jgi:hypothetical protein